MTFYKTPLLKNKREKEMSMLLLLKRPIKVKGLRPQFLLEQLVIKKGLEGGAVCSDKGRGHWE